MNEAQPAARNIWHSVARVARAQRNSSFSVFMQPKGNHPPFFLVPGIGGSAAFFHELACAMAPDHPFVVLQPRGIDGKTAPLSTIPDIAQFYVRQILQVRSSGPFHIGGWCLGGLVAFEIARQLIALGHDVAKLVMIDTQPFVGRTKGSVSTHFREMLSRTSPVLPWLRSRIRNRIWRLRVRGHRLRCELYLLARKRVPSKHREAFIMAADRDARSRYALHPYPGAITLVWSSQDPAWGNKNARIFDPEVAHRIWSRHAIGGLTFIQLDGDHYGIFAPPAVDKLACILKEGIE